MSSPTQPPRFPLPARLATLLLPALLAGCVPAAGMYQLDFAPGGRDLDPARLLRDGRVPRDRLLSIEEALQRAPRGSLILACWRRIQIGNAYGHCSHISRKYSDTQLVDTAIEYGSVGLYPISNLYRRYAVIVLDTGLRDEDWPQIEATYQKLRGLPYDLSNREGTYYCSTFQNALEEAAGLPPAIPWNDTWKMYVPADVLYQKHVKVLYVGVNPAARR
ncbi:hypothetical protein HNR42_000439 [Deinobacterium chartae]|uniref:Permuted papain-like amidase YaeF/Yiix C92 family enzyme n=1 Tax=Deinobacterium chartae TaxID=521158 RepID=A0A841HZ55_9DEIO|nr:hypothetical protein [Deinobacterium chartae]MBB6097025.1 hypothetical protein [Deinobacterium chartae]